MGKQELKTLKLQIKALEAELQECDTAAKHVCVYRAYDNACRKLYEATRRK